MPAFVNVDEVNGSKASSGFAVGVRSGSLDMALRDSLFAQRVGLTRLRASYAGREDQEKNEEAFKLAGQSPERFADFVRSYLLPRVREGLGKVGARVSGDPYSLKTSLAAVSKAKSAAEMIAPLATLLNRLDAQLTQLQLRKGDPADILQMVRWQRELFRRQPALSKLSCAADLVASSREFLRAREGGRLTNSAYPELLAKNSQCLREGFKAQGGRVSNARLFQSNDLAELEREHRAILLALAR